MINCARLPSETLRAAEVQVSRIFKNAGVEIEWWESDGTEPADVGFPTNVPVFFVKLLPDSVFPPAHPTPGAFGNALGVQAFIFVGRIQRATEEALVSFPRTVGHIIAHELGHLLLGGKSHFLGSVMSPRFGPCEFRQMERGLLLFGPAEARRMRDRIRTQRIANAAILMTPARNGGD
jgi:hypothetical protein